MPKKVVSSLTLTVLLAVFLTVPAQACTGLFAKAKDGGVVYARSLEFNIPIKSQLLLFPRGTACQVALPEGAKGPSWKTKYGFVGMNALGLPHVVDGMNEKGLQVGLFWFPGFSEYAQFDPKKAATTLTPWEIGEWLLGQCATVKEAREKLQGVQLVAFPSKELGGIPTAHFLVVDAQGDSLVVEPLGGKLVMRDDPVGVFTNSPSFDWHLTNLGNYINLSTQQAKSITIGQRQVNPLGNGAGMLGLPGDITPPSRFVRAAVYLNSVKPFQTTAEALQTLMRMHQAFYIAKGMAKPGAGETGPEEITQWEVYTDLKNHKLYFSTYDNLNFRMVDAAKLDYSSGPIRTLSLDQPQQFEDVTKSFH
jgi:choloylglycine hydrolase